MASIWRTLSQRLTSARTARERGKPTVLAAVIARAPTVTAAVLGLAIVAQAAAIALALSAEMAAVSAVRSATATGARAHLRDTPPLAEIVMAHLFGAAPQMMNAAGARAMSRSPLVLTGIIATGDPRDGFAIVGSSAASARTVYVGSAAAPGTILTDVYPQWVVLQRGRERLVLRLPHGDLLAAGGQMRQERSGPSTEGADDPEDASATAAQDFSPPPLSDSAAIVRAFALRPANVNGEQGERIMGTSINQKVLASLGLSPGEVITQINGVPVGTSNTPNLMRVLQSGNATLMVVKDGEESSVTLAPNSIAGAATLFRQTAPE